MKNSSRFKNSIFSMSFKIAFFKNMFYKITFFKEHFMFMKMFFRNMFLRACFFSVFSRWLFQTLIQFDSIWSDWILLTKNMQTWKKSQTWKSKIYFALFRTGWAELAVKNGFKNKDLIRCEKSCNLCPCILPTYSLRYNLCVEHSALLNTMRK